MIFSELYSAYYNAVAGVLKTAVKHPLKKSEIIDFAGNESVLDRVFYGGAGGLEAVGGLITSIIATMQLYEERKSISTIDLLSKSTAIASTIEKAVRGAADVVAMTTYAGTAVNEVARVVASPFLL